MPDHEGSSESQPGSVLVVSGPMVISTQSVLVYKSITIEPVGTLIFQADTQLTTQTLTVDPGRSPNLAALQVVGANGTNGTAPGERGVTGGPGAPGTAAVSSSGKCVTPAGEGGKGQTGGSGGPGSPATPGGNAPTVTINAGSITGQITILNSGGAGGTGGVGGIGGQGGPGGPGGSASSPCTSGPQGPGGDGGP